MGIVNARAWLFRVARNAAADRLRRRRDTVEVTADIAGEEEEYDVVDRLAACLPRALSELGAADREAITMCDLEGMAQDAFARRAGLTLPGAKARVQRARRRLREHLSQACRVRLDDAGHVCDFVPRPPLA